LGHSEYLATRKLEQARGGQLLELVRFLERVGLIKRLRGLFEHLPQAANRLSSYFSFEENCYLFYICKVHEGYWGDMGVKYDGQMEMLKDHIKMTVNARGFKMDLNSYFYKLLSQVDNVQFFDGG
jgi:hypothetical protein